MIKIQQKCLVNYAVIRKHNFLNYWLSFVRNLLQHTHLQSCARHCLIAVEASHDTEQEKRFLNPRLSNRIASSSPILSLWCNMDRGRRRGNGALFPRVNIDSGEVSVPSTTAHALYTSHTTSGPQLGRRKQMISVGIVTNFNIRQDHTTNI